MKWSLARLGKPSLGRDFWLIAGFTVLVFWFVWRSPGQTPAYHDEAAYLLQAKIFASGRWTASPRPLPEFFEEIHTFATPVVAAKYWPGHALVLIPGVWLGLPALMPALLAGAMGGLIYALTRRIAGALAALLSWLVWVSAPDTLFFGATYFSELTTGILWLLGWWALLEWRGSRQGRWLVLLAACVGWGAITRPLTMLVFAVPVAVVVVRDALQHHAGRSLLAPAAVTLGCLAIVPLWSWRTIGDWRTTPYTLYRRLYLPVDRPGFSVDSTTPVRPRPWDLEALSGELTQAHRAHTLDRLPSILADRVMAISKGMWGETLIVLLPIAVLSAAAWSGAATLAVSTAGFLVLAHLIYAYEPGSTLYYFELLPVLAFLTGVGLTVAIRWVVRRIQTSSIPISTRRVVLALGAGIYALGAVFHLAGNAGLARAKHDWLRRPQRVLETALAGLTDRPAIVFIRYAPGRTWHLSLISNPPDLAQARIWTVYDRGKENIRLIRRFPDRAPYLYDEATGLLSQLAS